MVETRIILAVLWICLMLNNLWGDVLRLISGVTKPGELMGVKASQGMWWAIAVLMVIPIIMAFLSLTLNSPVNRWANIIVPVIFIMLSLGSLPGEANWYRFILTLGIVFNVLTIWYAWNWN